MTHITSKTIADYYTKSMLWHLLTEREQGEAIEYAE